MSMLAVHLRTLEESIFDPRHVSPFEHRETKLLSPFLSRKIMMSSDHASKKLAAMRSSSAISGSIPVGARSTDISVSASKRYPCGHLPPRALRLAHFSDSREILKDGNLQCSVTVVIPLRHHRATLTIPCKYLFSCVWRQSTGFRRQAQSIIFQHCMPAVSNVIAAQEGKVAHGTLASRSCANSGPCNGSSPRPCASFSQDLLNGLRN